jgi:ABC-type sugar transport system permease subunit
MATTSHPAATRPSARRKRHRELLVGYAFLFPYVAIIVAFSFVPIFRSLGLSLFEWNGLEEPVFVGFRNFVEMVKDPHFHTSLRNTFLFSSIVTAATVAIGFLLAAIIDLEVPLWKAYRFVFFLNVVLPIAITSLLWMRIYDPYGLLNNLLGILNLDRFQSAWLGSQNTTIFMLMIVDTWQFCGFTMIFFLAGMQNIDKDIYEAATIDGASKLTKISRITIPLLKNTFTIVILLQLIFSSKVFDRIWIMTQGGPAKATEVFGTLLYTYAFREQRFGYGSVIAVFSLIVAFIYSVFYVRATGYREERELRDNEGKNRTYIQ